jgi:restriction system protein
VELVYKGWPLALLIGVFLVIKVRSWRRQEKMMAAGLYEVDRMSKREFRDFCLLLLRRLGYKVKSSPAKKQWVHFVVEKEGRHIAVLTKHYRRNVSSRLVEKIARSAPLYGCQEALLITNRDYTLEAKELANSLGVDLWNRDRIIDLLLALRRQGK